MSSLNVSNFGDPRGVKELSNAGTQTENRWGERDDWGWGSSARLQ